MGAAGQQRHESALTAACVKNGLEAKDATVIHARSNTPGLPVLPRMRELRALAAYLRSPSPAAQPEVTRRLTDPMNATQTRPWTALNLAT
jgi:hypothetical protein